MPLGPRPNHFPLVPRPAAAAVRRLPLLDEVRSVDELARPVFTVWEITLRCDLACRHCGSRAGAARPDELTTEEALDVVAQLRELGAQEVALIGGEAYLRSDFETLVRAITDAGMACTMVTGGRGITDERARAVRDAGLFSVSVSVDGLETTHDELRNLRGSFDAAMRALDSFRNAGVRIAANTQVNQLSLPELPELCERLLERGIQGWQVQLTTAMGRAGDEDGLLLQPYQMIEVTDMLARLKHRCVERRCSLWPGNNIGYYGPHEATLRDYTPECHRGACSAGRATLGIEANGNVKGCPSLPSEPYVGGNLREHRLEDIWRRAAPLRFARDRTVSDLWGYCGSCYYARTCLGGCNWTSHVLLGRPGNNPYCDHRARMLRDEGKRERVVRRSFGTGQPFDHGTFEIVLENWPTIDSTPPATPTLARGER